MLLPLGAPAAAATRRPDALRHFRPPHNHPSHRPRARSFNCDPGQKTIKLEAAIPLLQMLVPPARWALVAPLVAFLTAHPKAAMPKDTWAQLLLLWEAVPTLAKLPAYHESAAWPTLFDDFVEELERQQAKT